MASDTSPKYTDLPAGVRIAWRAGRRQLVVRERSSPFFVALTGGFAALLAYAALHPWTDKLAVPLFRAIMALVAAFLAGFLLRAVMNRATYFIEDGDLHFVYGPLPPRDRASLPLVGLERLGYAPLRGVVARYGDGTERLLCGYERGTPELPRALATVLDLDVVVEAAISEP